MPRIEWLDGRSKKKWETLFRLDTGRFATFIIVKWLRFAMCGRKKIYQLFKLEIFQLLTQITLLSRSRFSVFEMKITQSQNKLFSSGAIVASSLAVWPRLHGGIFFVLSNSYRCLSKFWMKLVYFNIQKHGIDDYLRKGRQILRFGPAVKSVLNLHMAETCGLISPLQSCMFTLMSASV